MHPRALFLPSVLIRTPPGSPWHGRSLLRAHLALPEAPLCLCSVLGTLRGPSHLILRPSLGPRGLGGPSPLSGTPVFCPSSPSRTLRPSPDRSPGPTGPRAVPPTPAGPRLKPLAAPKRRFLTPNPSEGGREGLRALWRAAGPPAGHGRVGYFLIKGGVCR